MSGDALSVYSSYVQGVRPSSGPNFTCYCPLHGETPGKSTRSFSFNTKTGAWICFAGCGGGYLPQFLNQVGLSRVQIDSKMERLSLQKPKEKSNNFRKPAGVLPEKILGLWDSVPEYMLNMGFTAETLAKHDIGFDSDRSRITFPIRDLRGRLRGVSGRHIRRTAVPRYKVYNSEIKSMGFRDYSLDKGDHLWRAHMVWPLIKEEVNNDPVVVVEGFKVAMKVYQSGIDNVVALMGTFMTLRQKALLELFDRPVIFCLDNDGPGRINNVKNSYKLNTLPCLTIDYPEGVKQLDELDDQMIRNLINNPISIKKLKCKHKGQTS